LWFWLTLTDSPSGKATCGQERSWLGFGCLTRATIYVTHSEAGATVPLNDANQLHTEAYAPYAQRSSMWQASCRVSYPTGLPILVLRVYFDISHQRRVHAVGGYIADIDAWDKAISPVWRSVIAAAPHPVKEFKASDCRQGVGDFSPKNGWTQEERLEFTKSVVSAITEIPRSHIMGIAAATFFDARLLDRIEYVDLPEARQLLEEYGLKLAVYGAIVHAINFAKRFSDEKLMVVFDRGKYEDWTSRAFDAVLDDSGIGDAIGTLVYGHSHEEPGLQAADLLAYETAKEVIGRAVEPRKVSRALEVLVESHPHLGFIFDEKTISERMKAGLSPWERGTEIRLFVPGEAVRAPGRWGIPSE
jgi:hypothetical protein